MEETIGEWLIPSPTCYLIAGSWMVNIFWRSTNSFGHFFLICRWYSMSKGWRLSREKKDGFCSAQTNPSQDWMSKSSFSVFTRLSVEKWKLGASWKFRRISSKRLEVALQCLELIHLVYFYLGLFFLVWLVNFALGLIEVPEINFAPFENNCGDAYEKYSMRSSTTDP